MKIAYTGWTWLVHHGDNQKYEFEQFLKEVSFLGYDSVENFAFITRFFDNDAEAVKGLLDKYSLEMVNLYEHFTDDPEADYQSAVAYTDFMQKIGATYLNLQGVMWKGDFLRPTDKEKIAEYARLSDRIGRLCRDKGLVACFHPHAMTPVFTEEDIDLYLSLTDPELVGLCLDTAHTTIAGMDPVQAVRKYLPRISYMHLKDVQPDPENLNPAPMSRFRALGLGSVDFVGVKDALVSGGYDGVLCVELDNPAICNYDSAMVSRDYIKRNLGY